MAAAAPTPSVPAVATTSSPIAGTETSIDAGTGNDTLVLAAGGGITAINLGVTAGADQTTGDSVAVSNFEYVNASALSTGITITGSSGTNFLTGGSGADTIDGAGGADRHRRGRRQRFG